MPEAQGVVNTLPWLRFMRWVQRTNSVHTSIQDGGPQFSGGHLKQGSHGTQNIVKALLNVGTPLGPQPKAHLMAMAGSGRRLG